MNPENTTEKKEEYTCPGGGDCAKCGSCQADYDAHNSDYVDMTHGRYDSENEIEYQRTAHI